MDSQLLFRLAVATIRRRWWVISACVALTVAVGAFIPRLTSDFTPSDLFATFGDQELVAAEFRDTFGNTDNVVLVLLEGNGADVLTPAGVRWLFLASRALGALEEVARVESIVSLPDPRPPEAAPEAGAELTVTDALFELYDMLLGPLAGRPGDPDATLAAALDDNLAGDTRAGERDAGEQEQGGLRAGEQEQGGLRAGEQDAGESGDASDPEPGAAPGGAARQPGGGPGETSTQSDGARDAMARLAPVIGAADVTAAQVERLRELAGGSTLVRGRLLSDDGTVAALAVFLREDITQNDQMSAAADRIHEVVSLVQVPDGHVVSYGGLPWVRTWVVRSMRADQTVLLPLSLGVSLLILLFAFRWLPALALPTAAVGMSAVILVGGMAMVGEPFNILNNIIPTLVIIIGISNAIHIINRYRDELSWGLDRSAAAGRALATMAVACFLTSFTTAVGFASLAVSRTDILKRFGWTAAVGIMVAYVITILLIPASLSMVRPPRSLRDAGAGGTRAGGGDGPFEGAIERITRASMRHRWAVIAGATCVAALAVFGGTRVHVDSAVLDQVNPREEVYRVTRLIERELGGLRPLEVYLTSEEADRLYDPDVIARLEEVRLWALTQPGVLSSLGYADFLREARAMVAGPEARDEPLDDAAELRGLARLMAQAPRDPLAGYLLDEARRGRLTITVEDMGARRTNLFIDALELELDRAFSGVEGVSIRLTGDAYVGSRGLDAVIGDLLGSLATAFVIIFVFLLVLLRSPRLGLLSVPPNVLPLLVTLGYMAVRGVPLNTSTAIIFSISIGMAVDGTIHYLARFREELAVDEDVEESLVRAARGTGKAIVMTCAALVVGFGVMLTSQFVPIRRFGELIAVTVLAMLVSTILVLPALVRLGYHGRLRRESVQRMVE